MARNFPNFLDAYLKYADDKFVPKAFDTWSCLSIIAAALERKVWLPWSDSFSFYPNIYVLLVAKPGAGKSVSLNKAVEILRLANGKTASLNIMPNQATEAKFIELLGHGKPFMYKTTTTMQSAAYYWASEASNSLRNIFGDFIACLTDFYDCPNLWQRATKKDGRPITLRNVCVNLLAGSTFDYLGKLVSDDNIMGGFASRPIYVLHRDEDVIEQEWQLGGYTKDQALYRESYRQKLVEDLIDINTLVGPVTAEPEFAEAWKDWRHKFERKRRKFKSEKLQSLLVRTNTNMLKVCMLMSVAESNDRILKIEHWERAHFLVDRIASDTPSIFAEAKLQRVASDVSAGQLAIIKEVRNSPGITKSKLIARMISAGLGPREATSLLESMIKAEQGVRVSGVGNGDMVLKPVGDTDDYL